MPNFEYNSNREDLIISEYGRHVQKLITHAKTLEDNEARQALAEEIIRLMYQMNPDTKNMSEYEDALWKHFFRIANYDIDVTPPNGEVPEPNDFKQKLLKMGYPQVKLNYRHYGKNIQRMITKALELEEGPVRDGFVMTIASYMKIAYNLWNRDHYVSDDNIRQDLKSMSKGELILPDDASLNTISNSNSSRKRRGRGPSGGRSNKGRSNKRRR